MRVPWQLVLVSLALLSAPAAQNDGPHLFHVDGAVVAKWVENGEVRSKRFGRGEPIALPAFAKLLGERPALTAHKPQKDTWKLPPRLLAISDVEGQYDHMFSFLRGNGVVDERGRWKFGKGHLVTIGDMVDRGTQQTETLWMLWRLQREAQRAGGEVHFVLGNHEVMQMGGDVRYTADKYKKTAELFGIPVEGLLGADTELGRWLRARNSLVRIGPYLFVHAGVSPSLARRPVDLGKANARMRKHLGVPRDKIGDTRARKMLWGAPGPLWYRGYFEEHAEQYGPVPTLGQVDSILANLKAASIVIGHTAVDKVTVMFGKRRVIAIDVPWKNLAEVRGLLIQGEKAEVVDHRGRPSPLR